MKTVASSWGVRCKGIELNHVGQVREIFIFAAAPSVVSRIFAVSSDHKDGCDIRVKPLPGMEVQDLIVFRVAVFLISGKIDRSEGPEGGIVEADLFQIVTPVAVVP